MLAKIAPKFVIRGVIQNSYYANYMAVELCKQIIGDSHNTFHLDDPKHFYVTTHTPRNATFMDISPNFPNPLSSSTSSKLRNTMKLSRNLQYTTKSKTFTTIWTNSPSNWRNSTEWLSQATQAPTSSQGALSPTKYNFPHQDLGVRFERRCFQVPQLTGKTLGLSWMEWQACRGGGKVVPHDPQQFGRGRNQERTLQQTGKLVSIQNRQ